MTTTHPKRIAAEFPGGPTTQRAGPAAQRSQLFAVAHVLAVVLLTVPHPLGSLLSRTSAQAPSVPAAEATTPPPSSDWPATAKRMWNTGDRLNACKLYLRDYRQGSRKQASLYSAAICFEEFSPERAEDLFKEFQREGYSAGTEERREHLEQFLQERAKLRTARPKAQNPARRDQQSVRSNSSPSWPSGPTALEWTLLISGSAVLAAGVVGGLHFGHLVKTRRRDIINKDCMDGVCLGVADQHYDDAVDYNRLRHVAWGAAIAGGAAIATGLFLWWLMEDGEVRDAGGSAMQVELNPETALLRWHCEF